MYILGKNTKKTMHKSYTKEYNIIAIFSLTIAITISLSFIIGSVIIYSYLNKLDNPSLFIQLISNEKLVYSSVLSAFLILIFILVYSIFPSIYFVHQYGKKTNNEIKRLFIKSTLVYNLLFACLALALFIYNINLSDWNKLLYLLNGLLGIAFTLFPIWISHYIIEIKYANSLVVKNNSLGIIYNIFTPTPFIAILFILICGIEVYEYMPKYNYSIISLFIFLFTFLFIPLLSSWTFNSLIIYRKKQKNKLIYIVILITSLLWLIPIYHISPFVMKIFAYQDKEEKIYYIEENFIKTNLEPTSLIVEVEKHKTKKTTYEDIEYNKYVAHCGKIYLDTGDKTVFKRWNSDNFVQIPSNKIFEYQGRTLTCEIIVVWENYRDFVRKLFQFKNH